MLKKIKSWDKGQWFRAVVMLIIAVISIVMTVLLTMWVLSLRDPDNLEWFQNVISSLGIGGAFLLLIIQYVQVVLAFVPGGPIQIVAGALYGPIGGLLVTFTGAILATASIYFLVSRYGQKAVGLIVGNDDINKYKFLQNEKKLQRLVLILYFIPGTPKDALTYLFALTTLPMSQFLFLSTLARLPAVLTSVLAGQFIINGEWFKVIVIFLILGGLSLLGLLIHRKFIGRSKSANEPQEDSTKEAENIE